MAQFKIGDKVIDTSNTRGTIIEVMPARRGRQLYKVSFPTGEADMLETDLKADFNVSDPFERCKSGMFGSYSDYAKRNTAFKISNSNNSTISSLKASKTLFRAYQFKPLLKFLNSPNRRLLVADEVGLGKTIEAGHIMLELKARGELKDVLIVCPKSLREKWRAELYEKFGLAFKIVETTADLVADLQSRSKYVRAIINYEKMRAPRKNKENGGSETNNKKYNNLSEYLDEYPHRFSLVLCDEAHKMKSSSTLTYHGAETVMANADAALFLTATPVMITAKDLFNLLHLLDNARYFNYEIFMNRLNENRPFVEAITKLNHNVPLKSIYEALVDTVIEIFHEIRGVTITEQRRISDLYKESPAFEELTELMRGDEDSAKIRARIQYLLSTMSVMNMVFSRTRKREVTTDLSQAERSAHICKVVLHSDEQFEFDRVIEEYIEDNSYNNYWGEETMTQGCAMGLVQKKRQIASSVWGYLNDEYSLDRGVDEYADKKDAKFEQLLKIIGEVFENGPQKIIVFALFRKTLKYLNIRLKKAGYNTVVIHGQVDNRVSRLSRFKHDRKMQILLSSEVGSEGLDMQFCNSMVNYDLPWNPMVVEQRIGRIDRFGQKAPVVNIYNMVVADSIQEQIYIRLLERIGIFRGTIGDMEAILDAELEMEGKKLSIQEIYNRMEKELFTKHLTKEEREKKIGEVERAIENEKENLLHLQEGLSNTLTNDAYFQDEIHRILNNNAYVTETELHNFVVAAIRQRLTTCSMEEVEDGIMEFKLPLSSPNALNNFLTQYCNNDEDSSISVGQFKGKVNGETSFRLTFRQDRAFDYPDIIYLNIYHPMIQACLNYFIQNDDKNATTFSYSLTADDVLKSDDKYILGLYQLNTKRKVQGATKNAADIVPVLFSVNRNDIVSDQDVVDRIYKRSQMEGNERNVRNGDIPEGMMDDIQYEFAAYMSDEKKRRKKEMEMLIDSDRIRNAQQTEEYYDARIKSTQKIIKDEGLDQEYRFPYGIYYDDEEIEAYKKEKLKRQRQYQMRKNQIAGLEREKNERIERINSDSLLSMEEQLVSLNLITII